VRITLHPNGRDIALATIDHRGGRFWVIENPFAGRNN
jgi:hypothetical protein